MLLGCVSVKYAPFDDIERVPKYKIQIFVNANNITRPYKEIGLITAESDSHSETELIKHLENKGRAIGADAIILQSSENSTGGYVAGQGIFSGAVFSINEKTVRAVAIEFTD